MVKTQHFHCCGLGISPWLDNKDPISLVAKKKGVLEMCVCLLETSLCLYWHNYWDGQNICLGFS